MYPLSNFYNVPIGVDLPRVGAPVILYSEMMCRYSQFTYPYLVLFSSLLSVP